MTFAKSFIYESIYSPSSPEKLLMIEMYSSMIWYLFQCHWEYFIDIKFYIT